MNFDPNMGMGGGAPGQNPNNYGGGYTNNPQGGNPGMPNQGYSNENVGYQQNSGMFSEQALMSGQINPNQAAPGMFPGQVNQGMFPGQMNPGNQGYYPQQGAHHNAMAPAPPGNYGQFSQIPQGGMQQFPNQNLPSMGGYQQSYQAPPQQNMIPGGVGYGQAHNFGGIASTNMQYGQGHNMGTPAPYKADPKVPQMPPNFNGLPNLPHY